MNVAHEDRVVIEGLYPKRTPDTLTKELMTPGDAAVVKYREHLSKWEKNGWVSSSKKPVANQDLWKSLSELSKTHDVNWLWVKGHSNDKENNRCDELAVKARIDLAKMS